MRKSSLIKKNWGKSEVEEKKEPVLPDIDIYMYIYTYTHIYISEIKCSV